MQVQSNKKSGHINVYQKFDALISDNGPDLTNTEYSIILSNKIESEFIQQFILGLTENKIKIDKFLEVLIQLVSTDQHLLIISLLLRLGARMINYSLYFDYLIKRYSNIIPIRNTLLLLFRFSGVKLTNTTCPADVKEIMTAETDLLIKRLDHNLLVKLICFLDNPNLIGNLKLKFNPIELIRDHSNQVLKYALANDLVADPGINEKFEVYFGLTIKYFNLEAFNLLLGLGLKPKYHQINILVLQIRSSPYLSTTQIVQNFLNVYLRSGGLIDSYQQKLLKTELLNIISNGIASSANILTANPNGTIPGANGTIADIAISNPNGTIPEVDYLDRVNLGNAQVHSSKLQEIIDTEQFAGTKLPEDVLNKLAIQRSFLKRLRFPVNSIQSSLSNDDYFKKMETALINLVRLHYNQMPDLSIAQMEKLYEYLNINTELCKLLSSDHYKRTFYVSCYQKLNEYPDILEKIRSYS